MVLDACAGGQGLGAVEEAGGDAVPVAGSVEGGDPGVDLGGARGAAEGLLLEVGDNGLGRFGGAQVGEFLGADEAVDEEIESVVDELEADSMDDDLGDALPPITKSGCGTYCAVC